MYSELLSKNQIPSSAGERASKTPRLRHDCDNRSRQLQHALMKRLQLLRSCNGCPPHVAAASSCERFPARNDSSIKVVKVAIGTGAQQSPECVDLSTSTRTKLAGRPAFKAVSRSDCSNAR